MNKLPVIAALILVSLAASAQDGASVAADPIVIRIGEVEIHQSEFEALLESLPAEYRAYVHQPGGMRTFAGDFVEMKVLAIEAEKQGVSEEPAVATQLRLVRDNTLASAMVERVEKSVEPDDALIQARYEASKSQYEQVSARHILIAFEGSPASREDHVRTDDEAKALAQKLKADIAAGGDFAEIAQTESDDTFSGQNGGDLGSFGRGQMVPEFENAVFGGKVGEIGEVVRTEFGYHIVEVTGHSSKPLEEVRDEIRAELLRERVEIRLKEMTSSFEVSFDDAYFGAAPEVAPEASGNGG